MQSPVDPIVQTLVARLDADLREAFEERAGIVQFDAGTSRAHAECLALLDVLINNPSLLSSLAVLSFHRGGPADHLITCDLDRARRFLSANGATETGVLDPARFLAERCDGAALLTPIR